MRTSRMRKSAGFLVAAELTIAAQVLLFLPPPTDGSEPTDTDPSITSGNSVSVEETMTLKAKVYKSGLEPSNRTDGNYTIQAAAPQMSPSGGTYVPADPAPPPAAAVYSDSPSQSASRASCAFVSTLRDDVVAEAVGKGDDGGGDGSVVGVFGDVAGERVRMDWCERSASDRPP